MRQNHQRSGVALLASRLRRAMVCFAVAGLCWGSSSARADLILTADGTQLVDVSGNPGAPPSSRSADFTDLTTGDGHFALITGSASDVQLTSEGQSSSSLTTIENITGSSETLTLELKDSLFSDPSANPLQFSVGATATIPGVQLSFTGTGTFTSGSNTTTLGISNASPNATGGASLMPSPGGMYALDETIKVVIPAGQIATIGETMSVVSAAVPEPRGVIGMAGMSLVLGIGLVFQLRRRPVS